MTLEETKHDNILAGTQKNYSCLDEAYNISQQ